MVAYALAVIDVESPPTFPLVCFEAFEKVEER